ncbi:hypothetical protein AMTR_s00080p00165150 [Amborella trichopoda]|uniref:Glycosyltransferases n=2 Tax=Amborella trichopoda TaxID=13333 RepID=W1PBI0_AMBTC|nr:hypothetical protein AMTR_s00080p00165150 [Amborella trichopoda]
MGFFTGFAPTSNGSSILPSRASAKFTPGENNIPRLQSKVFQPPENSNRSLMAEIPAKKSDNSSELSQFSDEKINNDPIEFDELKPLRLLIIVTTLRPYNLFQSAYLNRLGQTLKLVKAPLLWIVVESKPVWDDTAEVLRRSGVMYRHLVCRENATDAASRVDHQRNHALNHIKHHRLDGIVHFADPSNVYDLEFFDEIRKIEELGTWAVALLSGTRKKVVVEGPVCASSTNQVIGWHVNTRDNNLTANFFLNISSFAFNSSILWDPERWGRSSSMQHNSHNSIEFVQNLVLEDETKVQGLPKGCSNIMLWRLYLQPPSTLSNFPNPRGAWTLDHHLPLNLPFSASSSQR